jgi:Fur family transcriptional regulator, ferric uptake regulator
MDTNLLDAGLKASGLKVTLPRVKVLSVLTAEKTAVHLSAEDVYNRLRTNGEEVSLATVYRVLTQFESAGLVSRHCFDGDRSVYELNDGNAHDHLVCVRCDTVAEFSDPTLEHRLKDQAAKACFSLSDYTIVIYGLCQKCRAAA